MLTDQQLDAARLIAGAQHNTRQIAAKLEVTERTIYNWKADPEFQAAVKALSDEWREMARFQGIADQDVRLKSANERHRRLCAVIAARAKDPAMATVPGGKTGLLTVTYKMLNRVDEEGNRISEPVPEYAIDTGLLAALAALEQEVAIERGQWKLKLPPVTNNNLAITIIQRLEAGRKRLAKAKHEPGNPGN